MKVLQINKAYPPVVGGIEKVVCDIAESLCTKVEMQILVANDSLKAKDERVGEVAVRRTPSLGKLFSMPLAPFFAFELCKYRNVDIMHFHFPFPIGELSSLLVKTDAKKIVTWHSDIVRQKGFLSIYKPFLMKFLESADKIVVTSPNMMKSSEILKNFNEKCVVIPLGVNPKQFELTDEVRRKSKELKDKYEKPIVFFMGRLVYYKGVEYLIKAMKNIDAYLVIGGSGPLEKSLMKLAKDEGMNERTDFIGFVPEEELAAYYHACDLFVLPSVERSEAFGIVQLEAMACGKPVVSTKLTTGVPYANLDGLTGTTVPARDENALASAMRELLSNKGEREKLGKNAKKRVEEDFTTIKMNDRYYKLYCELLEMTERE